MTYLSDMRTAFEEYANDPSPHKWDRFAGMLTINNLRALLAGAEKSLLIDEEQAEGVLQRQYCNQQSLASAQTWISVEDERKPELGQMILMWVYAEDEGEDDEGRPFSMDKSQVQMGEYRDMGHGPFFDCFATPFADHEGVTHWMPLPAPPEGGA